MVFRQRPVFIGHLRLQFICHAAQILHGRQYFLVQAAQCDAQFIAVLLQAIQPLAQDRCL